MVNTTVTKKLADDLPGVVGEVCDRKIRVLRAFGCNIAFGQE